jgi:hypothetical protein
MRRHVTLAVAAAVALAAASQAEAAITINITTTPIASDLVGYTGYVLTFQANGNVTFGGVSVPETIGAFDLANANTSQGITTASVGIRGPMNQAWVSGGSTSTPTLNHPASFWTGPQTNDSTFLNVGYWTGGTPTPFSENNSLTGSPETGSGDSYFIDFLGSPTPTPGTFGLGSLMQGAGSALNNPLATPPELQSTSVQFALIIAPTGAGNVVFSGQVLDQNGITTGTFVFPNLVINAPVSTPEPASLGVLALGGLGLLAKRRKRA